ncbi:hypothetical protein MKW92_037806 [Papaver armeniacum]|nr:hypothetical protein MKW92_037806 [Papaver armeniacum]
MKLICRDRFVVYSSSITTTNNNISSARKHLLSPQLQTSIYQSINGIPFSNLNLLLLLSFKQTLQLSIKPNDLTFSLLLTNTSSSYSEAQGIHTHLLKSLLNLYARYGFVFFADQVFEDMPNSDVVWWNALICGYSYNGYDLDAWEIFFKVGLDVDSRVQNSLTYMYGKCNDLVSGRFLFEKMSDKCIISWNTMIGVYGQNGYIDEAMLAFTMVCLLSANNSYVIKTGLDMDSSVITSLICMYSRCGKTELAGLLGFTNTNHLYYGIKSGLTSDTLVVNGLISMYTKLDNMEAAFSLFRDLQERTLISWNSIISSCVQLGRWDDAMKLFYRMKMQPGPNYNCKHVGRGIHGYILRHHLEMEDFVLTGLIDMYTKCGSIGYAERLFRCIRQPCLATWNAMIKGYGTCGYEFEALQHYSEMVKQGQEPDEITFLGVLFSCSHGFLIHKGRRYFLIMREEFGIIPRVQHCASMVDLLSQLGFLDEAVTFIKNMEVEPDSVVWLALLSGCCTYRDVWLAECIKSRFCFWTIIIVVGSTF